MVNKLYNTRIYKVDSSFNGLLQFVVDISIFVYVTSIYVMSYNATFNIISRALALLLIALLGLYTLVNKTFRFSALFIYFGLFVFFGICSCLWAVDQSKSLSSSFTIAQIFVLISLLYNYIAREKKTNYLLFVLSMAGTIFAIYTIAYFGLEDYIAGIEDGLRVGSEINNLNAIGMMCAGTCILNVWQVFFEKKYYYVVFAIICFFVALGSGSRTAIVGLLIAIVLLFILKGDSYKKIKSIIQLAVVLWVLYAILKLPAFENFMLRFEQMINGILGKGNVDNSSTIRLEMIRVGFETFFENPIIGIGIGNSHIITAEHFAGLETYLHNNYIELLATTGIAGTLLYYMLFIIPAVKMIKPALEQNKLAILSEVILALNLVFHIGTVDYYNKVSYMYLLLVWLCLPMILSKRGYNEKNNQGTEAS